MEVEAINVKVGIDDDVFTAAIIVANRWNGWVIPFFTRDEGLKIMTWIHKQSAESATEAYLVDYDADRDVFTEDLQNEWQSEFPYEDSDGGRLYGIGAWSWTWSLAGVDA